MKKQLSRCCVSALSILGLIALAVTAQSTEELMTTGADRLRSGDYSQAAASFKKVVARDPGSFEAQYNLAISYLAWGHDQEALDGFRKASNINPRSADVWMNMGVAYQRLGSNSKAVESLSKASSLDPSNLDARLNLASMYIDLNRPGDAIAQYKQVLAVDGSNSVALTNLARLLIDRKDIAEAKRFLGQAIAGDAANAEAHWWLGTILWKHEKNPDEAIKEYQKAVSLEPTTQIYYNELGLVLAEKGKTKEAIDVYKTYLAYLGDVIKKEEIQKRIDALENPGSTGAAGGTEDVKKLRRGEGAAPAQEEHRMDVGQSTDALGDLNALTQESAPALDLAAEAKKKAKGGK